MCIIEHTSCGFQETPAEWLVIAVAEKIYVPANSYDHFLFAVIVGSLPLPTPTPRHGDLAADQVLRKATSRK